MTLHLPGFCVTADGRVKLVRDDSIVPLYPSHTTLGLTPAAGARQAPGAYPGSDAVVELIPIVMPSLVPRERVSPHTIEYIHCDTRRVSSHSGGSVTGFD